MTSSSRPTKWMKPSSSRNPVSPVRRKSPALFGTDSRSAACLRREARGANPRNRTRSHQSAKRRRSSGCPRTKANRNRVAAQGFEVLHRNRRGQQTIDQVSPVGLRLREDRRKCRNRFGSFANRERLASGADLAKVISETQLEFCGFDGHGSNVNLALRDVNRNQRSDGYGDALQRAEPG